VTSMLVRRWAYGININLPVFMVVIGMILESEVISLPKQISDVINRNKDINVIQTEK
jgi:hypothetical protein